MCRLGALIIRQLNNTHGQAMILVATTFVVLFGFVTLSTDFGHYMRERQRHQQALDAAVLAGAQLLPSREFDAATVANEFAVKNGLEPGMISAPRFGCFVKSSDADPTVPDSGEVLALCPQLDDDPVPFQCADGRCFHDCPVTLTPDVNSDGASCNTIHLQAQRNVDFLLAPIYARLVGNDGELTNATVDLRSTACRGRSCGTPPEIRMVMIIDQSSSMGAFNKFEQAKSAATNILLSNIFRPMIHLIAIGTMPLRDTDPGFILTDLIDERPVLAATVNALGENGAPIFGDTNLSGPIEEATNLLGSQQGTVRRQIVLLTDGAPSGSRLCADTLAAASIARQEGIQIFTIHYGEEPEICPDSGQDSTDLLAEAASGINDHDNCEDENNDSDSYLCQEAGADLTSVFERVVTRILQDVGTGSSLLENRLFN
ncbi:hypothetical protein C2W62_02875 [Candidatus Entotheonella serta]|nr:hypothetical protein C2W62_02875 [Candidatus Entotheonella serta]